MKPTPFRILSTPPQVDASGPDPLRGFDADQTILVPRTGYIQAVRNVLGGTIDIDLCSSSRRQALVDASAFYPADRVEDALAEPWYGKVWLQTHPHAKVARRQLRKLLVDYLGDRITEAIILINHAELCRYEPLLYSFPFCLHYRRLALLRWSAMQQAWTINRSSVPSTTFYLPRKLGVVVDEERLAEFVENFAPMGRIIIAEELDRDWQMDCWAATGQARVRPLLTRRGLQAT